MKQTNLQTFFSQNSQANGSAQKPSKNKRPLVIDDCDENDREEENQFIVGNKITKKLKEDTINDNNEIQQSNGKHQDQINLPPTINQDKNKQLIIIQEEQQQAKEEIIVINDDKIQQQKQNLRKISNENYHCIHDAPFKKGDDVPFSFLVDAYDQISEFEGQNSKALKIDVISKMFRTILLLNQEQIYMAYYFSILKIAPDYELNELGVGKEILMKAISKSTGRTEKKLRESLQEEGDLGLVAAKSKACQKTMDTFFKKQKVEKNMLLKTVYQSLVKVAHAKGQNSTSEREGIIMNLLFNSTSNENKYIVRFIEKNLKIQAAEKTMQAGLTKAIFDFHYYKDEKKFEYTQKQQEAFEKYDISIKRCLSEYPNYQKVIQTLIEVGKDIDALFNQCKVTPGTPCKPMLAKPSKSIQVIFKRFENMKFTCEFKYDGLRGQVHYIDGEVFIFSRNLENMTETYPDIVLFIKEQIKKTPNIKNFILDSEIVAFDQKTNNILSFQTLSTRGRKNVNLESIGINVCIFMFDLIYLNDESLLQVPLTERRNKISEYFQQVEGKFCFAEHRDTDNIDEIQDFLQQSIKIGCEGLMVKTLNDNSTYEPAKRSFKWLKLKKDYLETGLGDSFDLVPIAALYGAGKRKGRYGAYLLACYNEDLEVYETICKIGTGFSDDMLDKLYQYFQDKIIKAPLKEYRINDFDADVWFDAQTVWEVKGADLQISPVYTAGIGEVDKNKGIGLRFPRLLKVRDDKKPYEATSSTQIVEIYNNQAVVNLNQEQGEDDDDYY